MYGTVSRLQARINLTIYSANQSEMEIECVIDTGFEGFLTLPAAIVETLELPYFMDIKANLADDSDVKTDVYLATILWGGVDRVVPVLALGRRPLLGTALLQDLNLSIDFYEGGTVVLDDIL
jgi:clan AA aspartic protease